MNDRLTDNQLDDFERELTTYEVTVPTRSMRRILEEIRELRDQVCLLQMKVDGGKAILDAVTAAANKSVDTKLSEIQIERPNGPPFYLVDALIGAK